MSYILNFKNKSFIPSGKIKTLSEEETKKRNKEISKAEIEFILKKKPKTFFCYPSKDNCHITTWIGEIIGKIVSFGMAYQSNFGDWRRSIEVKLSNGLEYYGTIYNGNYCRLKKRKGKRLK